QPVDEQEPQPGAARHTRHAFFMTKAEHAIQRGAKAILIVNPVVPNTPDRLYDFASGRGMGLDIPMVNITRAAANEMLAAADAPSLHKLQQRIERRKQPCPMELRGVS